ncbi:M67 family metallopeptidase [Sphingomonas bacterium]|uniref:M67 family metallopeptidase n=1 Tax=Sphingomonas bacterium TaxID=1895847 RepID=UPI0015757379|nr:M67 family metallopeptidase [Sphingomonas bacterium]
MAATVISAALIARLIGEAAAAPDREICGLLFGTPTDIAEARRARNVAPSPAERFEIDPTMLLSAHRAARVGGPKIVGCYHSHPSGSAIPSERDRAAAEPGTLWLIIARGVARLWLAGDDAFAERVLTIG